LLIWFKWKPLSLINKTSLIALVRIKQDYFFWVTAPQEQEQDEKVELLAPGNIISIPLIPLRGN
jgi:hypothetical protein